MLKSRKTMVAEDVITTDVVLAEVSHLEEVQVAEADSNADHAKADFLLTADHVADLVHATTDHLIVHRAELHHHVVKVLRKEHHADRKALATRQEDADREKTNIC